MQHKPAQWLSSPWAPAFKVERGLQSQGVIGIRYLCVWMRYTVAPNLVFVSAAWKYKTKRQIFYKNLAIKTGKQENIWAKILTSNDNQCMFVLWISIIYVGLEKHSE